jgi:hypothetical protein
MPGLGPLYSLIGCHADPIRWDKTDPNRWKRWKRWQRMSQTVTTRDRDEYRALRATIRERGTARVCLFAGGFVAWGAITLATATLASTPLATLLPLLVLAALFEAIYALHVGVERIGRYIQVFHEQGNDRGWEHVAMAFGRPKNAATVNALFSMPFVLAIVFNAAPALLLHPTIEEMVFVGGAHALFALRLFFARAAAARQRAIDLERFAQLKRGSDV